jgi:hypothetical protein
MRVHSISYESRQDAQQEDYRDHAQNRQRKFHNATGAPLNLTPLKDI